MASSARDARTPVSPVATWLFIKCSYERRGAGRQRRERNWRPLPRPMDGSNTAIGKYFSQALALSASRGKVCSQKNPWRVRLRQGHTSRRSSRLPYAIRHLHSRHGVITTGVHADTLKAPRPGSEPTWSGAPISGTQGLPNPWRKCW